MKKFGIVILSFGLALSMLSGCGKSSSKYDYGYSANESAAMTEEAYMEDYSESYDLEYPAEYDKAAGSAQAPDVKENAATTNRKLIRTINMTVETNNFSELTGQIKAKTESLGGYMESVNIAGSEEYNTRYASYTLRIPATQADELVNTITGKSNIVSTSENVEDVTLKYVDIKSRKESLEVEYSRLEELMRSAENIEELIYIEERLADVRYEIQSIESQIRSYDNLVDYTTIYLNVDEVRNYSEPEIVDPTYGQRLVTALSHAMESIWKGLQGFSIFIIVLIPYLVVIGIPVALIVLLIKKIVKKNAAKKAAKRAAYAEAAKVKNEETDYVDESVPYTERISNQNTGE